MVIKRYDILQDKISSQPQPTTSNPKSKRKSQIDMLKLEKSVTDFMRLQV